MKKMMFAALFTAATLSALSAFEATVVSAKGKVEVQNGEAWKALAVGNTLKKGDVVQTGFKSELVLQIKESTVTVAPLSRLTIEQLAEKETKDETRLYLDTGSLKSNVKKAENRRVGFTVKSPVATASVRGTELVVTNGYGSTDVQTLSGSVAVWKSNNAGASVATEAEDAAPEAPAMNGASPQDVSGGEAPRGAFTVNAGQTAGFAENAPTTQPQSHAARNAADIGRGTQPASAGEAVALGGPADRDGNDPMTAPKPQGVQTGSAIITVTFPQ